MQYPENIVGQIHQPDNGENPVDAKIVKIHPIHAVFYEAKNMFQPRTAMRFGGNFGFLFFGQGFVAMPGPLEIL